MPQSASAAHEVGHDGCALGERPKYWMPTEIPLNPPWVRKEKSALVMAFHFVWVPPPTLPSIEPD